MTPTYNSFLPSSTVSKDLALRREQLYAALALHSLLGCSLWPGQLFTAPVASNWAKHPLSTQKKGQNVDVPNITLPYNRKSLNPRNSFSYESALPKLIKWQIFWPVSWCGQFSCLPVPKCPVYRLCASQERLSGSKVTSLSGKRKHLMRLPSLHLHVFQTWDATCWNS